MSKYNIWSFMSMDRKKKIDDFPIYRKCHQLLVVPQLHPHLAELSSVINNSWIVINYFIHWAAVACDRCFKLFSLFSRQFFEFFSPWASPLDLKEHFKKERAKSAHRCTRDVVTKEIAIRFYILTPWLMEPGGSMPHSQGLSNNSYPELNQPNSPHWYLSLQGPF